MDVNLSLVSQMPKANRNVRQEADENGTTVMGAGIMVSPSIFQQQAAYAAWSAEGIARMGLSSPGA
jgi:hypothetical protein